MPARSEITPPAAANRYGTAIRRVWMTKTVAIIARSPYRASRAQKLVYLGNRRGDGDDHHCLQHVDELLRHECIDRQPALRDCREQERGDHDTNGVRASNDRDRDAEKASTASKPPLVVMLVPQDILSSSNSRSPSCPA